MPRRTGEPQPGSRDKRKDRANPTRRPSRADHAATVRASIIKCAVDLFSAHGFPTTTMADIAQAAGVSRRTLFRYFATKEQVALAYQDGILDLLLPALAAQVPGEGALTAMMNTLAEFVGGLSMNQALSLSDLLVANPSLRAHNLQKYRDIEVAFGDAVIGRCGGGNPAQEARIKAACVVGAWRAANEAWLDGGRVGHPAQEITAAFAELMAVLRD